MPKLLAPLALLIALLVSACDTTGGDTGAVDTAVARVLATATAASRSTQATPAFRVPDPRDSSIRDPGQAGWTFGSVTMNDSLPVNTHEVTETFVLQGGSGPQVWRISVEFNSELRQRLVSTEVQGAVPSGVDIAAYRITQGQPLPGSDTRPEPTRIYMYGGDVLYVRAFNGGSGPQRVTVRVMEETELAIDPSTARLGAGGYQAFKVTQAGTSYSPEVRWSVEEGAAGGTVSTNGAYQAPAQAGTYHVVATTIGYPRAQRISATVTVAPTAPTPTVAATATPTRTPVPTAKPTPTPPSGAWVLKSTNTYSEVSSPNKKWVAQAQSATGTITAGNGATVETTHTWSAPPARLYPGQKLQITVTAGGVTQGSAPGLGAYAQTGMYIAYDGAGPMNSDGGLSVPVNQGAPRASGTKTVTWQMFAGSKGKTLIIEIGAGWGEGSHAATKYIYEWDPDAASQP